MGSLDESKVIQLAEEKISSGRKLLEILDNYQKVEGVQKTQRRILQELKFLEKMKSKNTLKGNHVMCSNLSHFEFLVKVLADQEDVVHVDCGFLVENRPQPLKVDIVCEHGTKWIKVIARNSKGIEECAQGRAGYGSKSIVDKASEFISAARQNLYMFQPPKVLFYFSCEIDTVLVDELTSIGVGVRTLNTLHDNSLDLEIPSATFDQSQPSTNTLNLDISTMLAYISSLTNGSNDWIFKEPILTDQARRERECPLKPVLNQLFQDKRLICCQTAMESFREIVDMLAAPSEKTRADSLIAKVEVYPDISVIPKELQDLSCGGKIKPRSLKIFAFGLANRVITVTSNEGFIRSAKMQGIHIPAYLHQARALTEAKEKTGQRIRC